VEQGAGHDARKEAVRLHRNRGRRVAPYGLTEVRDAATGALIASFSYDGLGRRLSQTTPSGTTYHHYDGDKVAFETDEAGSVIRAYTYGPDGLPATMTHQGRRTTTIRTTGATC